MSRARVALYAAPGVEDLREIDRFAREAEAAGAAALHLDIADGNFVPLLQGGTDLVRAVAATSRLPLQIHLLTLEPERHLDTLRVPGVRTVYVHVESTARLYSAVARARALGMMPGVAANPASSIVDLEEILPYVDSVLLPPRDPGDDVAEPFPSMERRIFRVRRLADKWKAGIDVVVDGRISTEMLPALVSAGATSLVVNAGEPDQSVLPALTAMAAAVLSIGSA
jgi:ribulose-phosphate 3-epimerase